MKKDLHNWLVISDIDGTFMNLEGEIPQRNIDALKAFTTQGGRFAFASGRSAVSMERFLSSFADQATVNAPVIVCNGSAIYDVEQRKHIHHNILPPDAADVVRAVLEQYPEACAEVCIDRDTYVIGWNASCDWQLNYEGIPYKKCTLEQVPGADWYKVVFAMDPAVIGEMAQYIASLPHSDIQFFYSTECLYEMLPKDCNKGTALCTLAEILGISLDNTAAIGDYYNDTELLQTAGISAVAGQAPEDLKAIADMTVSHCDEGAVGDFLYKLMDE